MPRHPVAESSRLDRLSARFAYVVIAANVVIFAGQGIRYLINAGLI
jgi:hypothetical protein